MAFADRHLVVEFQVRDETRFHTQRELVQELSKAGASGDTVHFWASKRGCCVFASSSDASAALVNDNLLESFLVCPISDSAWDDVSGGLFRDPVVDAGLSGAAPADNANPIDPDDAKMAKFFNLVTEGRETSRRSDIACSIAPFSGIESKASFEEWEYDIKCLGKEGVADTRIKQAIRKSVRGEPAKVLIRLGDEATVVEILHKFRGIYGSIEKGGVLLERFSAATQRSTEAVTNWSCRLEDMLAELQAAGKLSDADAADLLVTRLWGGLFSSKLKEATRFIYDSEPGFDELVRRIRSVETDLKAVNAGVISPVGAKPVKSHVQAVVAEEAVVGVSSSITTPESTTHALLQQILKRIGQLEAANASTRSPVSAYRANLPSCSTAPTPGVSGQSTHGLCSRCGWYHKLGCCTQVRHRNGHSLN
jgi:hypothetical protein